jgi:hypothetical protein
MDRDLSLHHRNLMLLDAAHDIFGFRRGRSWVDFKKNISDDQIRELYQVQADLWPPQTDWAAVIPKPVQGTLSALYLGDIRPELTLRNILRFSLYSDTIFVVDPFMNPNVIKPKYNPIENPNQYKQETIKLIYFLFSVAPWIKSKMLYLIPDPGESNVQFKWETMELARARRGGSAIDPRDLEEGHAQRQEDRMRVLLALPDEQLLSKIRRTDPTLTPEQEQKVLAYARSKLRSDPVAWEQSIADRHNGGQLIAARAGTNLETALLICKMVDAFPYTNMHTIWRYIIEAHDQLSDTARMWSPFTKAFQALDFRFLNNVAPSSPSASATMAVFRASVQCSTGSETVPRTSPASRHWTASSVTAKTISSASIRRPNQSGPRSTRHCIPGGPAQVLLPVSVLPPPPLRPAT